MILDMIFWTIVVFILMGDVAIFWIIWKWNCDISEQERKFKDQERKFKEFKAKLDADDHH